MFNILALVLTAVFSGKAIAAVGSQSTVYTEHTAGPDLTLTLLAILPIGPSALMFLPAFTAWLAAAMVALALFAPAPAVFRRQAVLFDRTGTSRTAAALKSANMGLSVALAGLLYVGAYVVFSLAAASI